MSPATAQASVYALLTDGTTIEIAPAGPQDFEAVRQMHATMSPDNAYLRFFNLSPLAAEREAKRVCREPGADHAALLAWIGSQLVGVASYEPTGKAGLAEIAFAVADHMHGRGIATLLLEHLVSLARRRRLAAFTAETLATNAAMLRVFADAGLPAQRRLADGLIELTFPLDRDHAASQLESYLTSVEVREQHADVASLRYLLRPASVAVIGASRKPGTVGRAILHNIVTSGFSGHLYAVNPRARQIEGIPCVPAPADLPEPVDLAVLAVPAAAVRAVAQECGQRGVRAIVVITAGLDTGAGADLLAICRRHGMRLVGPNCFGICVPDIGLDATFAAAHPAPGVAGLVVQSGGLGVALLDHLSRLGIGITSFASVGDKYDVSSNDMLMWWANDGRTRLALLYVESFGSPRKFARTARRVGQQMPVLTVHSGRSEPGQQAAASHTAAAATPMVTREALFGQAGIIAAASFGELLEVTALLASQPLPDGDRVAIVSNAGGAGVLAADACVDNGLRVATLAGHTQRRLRHLLPAAAAVKGPVDTTAAVSPQTLRSCLAEVAADEGVDMIIAITVPTAIADLVPAICSVRTGKPIAIATLAQPEAVRLLPRGPADLSGQITSSPEHGGPAEGGPAGPDAGHGEAAGVTAAPQGDNQGAARCTSAVPGAVPCYAYPESAARAFGYAVRYQGWRAGQRGSVPRLDRIRADDARALVGRFLATTRHGGWLSASDTVELLGCYGIPLAAIRPVTSEEAAVSIATEIGGPVALKADVPGLVHKSDSGGVKLGLRTRQEVRQGYRELAGAFGRDLARVLVQPMITGGVEVLVGVVQEPMFGPLVVFGLGGVATEVLRDHAARLAPLTDTDADQMIREVRAAPLLFGHRGGPHADIGALTDTLLRVSRLADDLPEVAELDLNPLVARPDGVWAVDARVRLTPAEPQDPFLRRLR
jgi:acyl-CoA synthetase (NDP forming)/GNAT superfamily N-acetyltransferase